MTDASYIKATPFMYGGGHLQPNRAMDPGLVYDLSVYDYFNLLCALKYNRTQIRLFTRQPFTCRKQFTLVNMNYPSITVPNLNDTVTVRRKVKNVGKPGTYKARIRNPPGVLVNIKPDVLKFSRKGEEKSFMLTLTAKDHFKAGKYVFGQLTWTDNKHYVRSPIGVQRL